MYEGENNGVLMLTVSEMNIKKNDAVVQAIKDAYFQILFRGIPGSSACRRALLGTEEDGNHSQYYNDLMQNGRLYSFITFSALSSYKRKIATVQLSINIQALIEDMERKNIYRRLGLF